jgi:hypothetical protein
VVKKAAKVPIIPCAHLSNLPGMKFFANEKMIKSPIKTTQKRIALKRYFVLILL